MRIAVTVAFGLLALPGLAQTHYRGPGDLVPVPSQRPLGCGTCQHRVHPRPPERPPFNPAPRPDLTRWEFWWEINKGRYLWPAKHPVPEAPLDRILATPDPVSADAVRQALHQLLDRATEPNVLRQTLIALAKIGTKPGDAGSILRYREFLRHADASVAAACALGMGLRGNDHDEQDLLALATGGKAGRRLLGGRTPPEDLRSFAVYGLARLAETSDDETRSRVVEFLLGLLDEADGVESEARLASACVLGLRAALTTTPDRELARRVRDALWPRYLDQGASEDVTAHVPAVIARASHRGSPEARPYLERFHHELLRRRAGDSPTRRAAAAAAIGHLAQPVELDPGHARYSHVLLDVYEKQHDPQASRWALVALAEIGGDHNREALLGAFARQRDPKMRDWLALALGVLGHTDPSPSVRSALLEAFEAARGEKPSSVALALGLCRHRAAAAALERCLSKNKHRDDLTGFVGLGLALMGADAAHRVEAMLGRADRRPHQAQRLIRALALLDPTCGPRLLDLTEDRMTNADRLGAMALSLGRLDDPRTVRPLLRWVTERSTPSAKRACAIAALGWIVGRESRPWNDSFAQGVHYRRLNETVTNRNRGLLDWL